MLEEKCHEMERLAEREKGFLWYQALHIAIKPEDAEDLLQETLMKVCKGFDGFRPETNFRAWARKIMLNTHINRKRRQDDRTASLEDINFEVGNAFDPGPGHVSDMGDPEAVFFQNHIGEDVMSQFVSMPEKYRTAFLLFHFNGYTYGEISTAMNISAGTVKSRIHRARLHLSGRVRGTFDENQHSGFAG